MPIMNGYDASIAIRKYYKKKRLNQPMIVACTGHTEEDYIFKAWRHMMDEVIPKPANIAVIKQILEEQLEINDYKKSLELSNKS